MDQTEPRAKAFWGCAAVLGPAGTQEDVLARWEPCSSNYDGYRGQLLEDTASGSLLGWGKVLRDDSWLWQSHIYWVPKRHWSKNRLYRGDHLPRTSASSVFLFILPVWEWNCSSWRRCREFGALYKAAPLNILPVTLSNVTLPDFGEVRMLNILEATQQTCFSFKSTPWLYIAPLELHDILIGRVLDSKEVHSAQRSLASLFEQFQFFQNIGTLSGSSFPHYTFNIKRSPNFYLKMELILRQWDHEGEDCSIVFRVLLTLGLSLSSSYSRSVIRWRSSLKLLLGRGRARVMSSSHKRSISSTSRLELIPSEAEWSFGNSGFSRMKRVSATNSRHWSTTSENSMIWNCLIFWLALIKLWLPYLAIISILSLYFSPFSPTFSLLQFSLSGHSLNDFWSLRILLKEVSPAFRAERVQSYLWLV